MARKHNGCLRGATFVVTIRMLGIEHLVAKNLRGKIHEHSIACADKLIKSRRMLERSSYRQNRKRPRADPP